MSRARMPTRTRRCVGFQNAGATFDKYTEYAGAGHEIWDMVYADANMWTWLWAKTR